MEAIAPLNGITVIDFTTLLPGPLATLMLAEAGAEVIKIEKPGGEDMRRYPPRWTDGLSAPFAVLNRGKRCVEADLKRPDELHRIMPLLERADILVEQFRPGVMARLGLGYDDLKKINPGLIYCSISGYGQSGPRVDEAGHDLNYVGATGLLALSHGPIDRPTVPPALIADIAGGSFPAMINILLALQMRDKTGEGTHLDIAMADATFTFCLFAQAEGAAGGDYPASGGGLLTGGSPRYGLYRTLDDKLAAVAALEEKFWRTFCSTIELPDSYRDDRSDGEATRRAVSERIAGRTAGEWAPIFADADCCVTIVKSLEEALADPHFRRRGLFDHVIVGEGGKEFPAAVVPVAPQFRGGSRRRPAPRWSDGVL